MVYLLAKKPELVAPIRTQSAKIALLDIAKVLRRDSIPEILLTSINQEKNDTPTVEGAVARTSKSSTTPSNPSTTSSEGAIEKENITNIETKYDRINRNITPVTLHNSRVHLTLYSKHTVQAEQHISTEVPTNRIKVRKLN